jgi:hypothetical protein
MKRKWESKKAQQEGVEQFTFKPKTNKHSAALRDKAENYQAWVAENNRPFEVNSLNSVYSTDIGQNSMSMNHPLYAVQRLYETSEAWKEKRERINCKLKQQETPFKPAIYSKKSTAATSQYGSKSFK